MSISATFMKEISRQKTAGQLREGAALRFPFYIHFADGSLPSGFLSAEIQPIQECCDLGAGAGGVGIKLAVLRAGEDGVFHNLLSAVGMDDDRHRHRRRC